MKTKYKKALSWTARFFAACLIFFVCRVATDWLLDNSPLKSLNPHGILSIIITVLVFERLQAYCEKHGLK